MACGHDDELMFSHSYGKNGHKCANKDMHRQTVKFLVHAGMRMVVDSCVVVS